MVIRLNQIHKPGCHVIIPRFGKASYHLALALACFCDQSSGRRAALPKNVGPSRNVKTESIGREYVFVDGPGSIKVSEGLGDGGLLSPNDGNGREEGFMTTRVSHCPLRRQGFSELKACPYTSWALVSISQMKGLALAARRCVQEENAAPKVGVSAGSCL
jgi:hypothetical protein